jgi:hypothetical protein
MWILILLGSIGVNVEIYSLKLPNVPGYKYLQIVSEKQPDSLLSTSEIDESNKVSGWKKAGIYGLEFAGGYGISSGWYILVILGIVMSGYYAQEKEFITYFTIGNTLLTGPTVWGIGKIFKQKGSLWKSMIGAGIGGAIFSILFTNWHPRYHRSSLEAPLFFLILSLPSLGAVIGYNL